MSPNELISQLQEWDYDYFLDLMLENVPERIDKREGSIIFDAVAPAAMVMAQQALALANIVKQTYVKTAQDEFLDYRAVEYGTARYEATYTEARATFIDGDGTAVAVNVGDKFASIGEAPIFYTVTSIEDDLSAVLTADVAGTEPNTYLGQILPITPNDAVNFAEIVEVTAPARAAESDEHLRARLLRANRWIAYGGNVADYLDMLSNIREVGAAQVYPVWDGAGTVKLVILNNDLLPASKTLVKQVKEEIDPEESTTLGYGLAPIDHRVTVSAPEVLTVNIHTTLILDNQVNPDVVKANIKTQLEQYFSDLRKSWNTINSATGRGYSMIIYRSKILASIMLTSGVYNAQLPELNGKDEDIKLIFNNNTSQLPVLGEVVLDG